MDWIARLNEIMDYIEEHLTEEISTDAIARIAGCSTYNFQRMFSYLADVPLAEYIRNRRLTMAAFEILNGRERIIDVALRSGYESQEAFSRAFRNFHGVLPSAVRNGVVSLKSCPKLSFQVTVKGEYHMNYQIKQYPAFSIAGVAFPMPTAEVFQRVPVIWERSWKDGTIPRLNQQLLTKCSHQPAGFVGIAAGGDWGKAQEMEYWIGVTNFVDGSASPRVPAPEGMKELAFPAATWVVFQAEGELPESVQNIHKHFYSEWLVNSGYQLADLPVIESYQLDEKGKEFQEVWIAIRKA